MKDQDQTVLIDLQTAASEIFHGAFTARALYVKCLRGQLPYFRLGRRILFDKAELLAFLKKGPGLRAEQIVEYRQA